MGKVLVRNSLIIKRFKIIDFLKVRFKYYMYTD